MFTNLRVRILLNIPVLLDFLTQEILTKLRFSRNSLSITYVISTSINVKIWVVIYRIGASLHDSGLEIRVRMTAWGSVENENVKRFTRTLD